MISCFPTLIPANGVNVTDSLVISPGAASINGYHDALSCLLRVGISVEANFLFPHCPVEALNSPYGLRVIKGNTPVGYP